MSSQIPDDIAQAVRLAASTISDYSGDPNEIRRRWRRRRQRRINVAVAAAVTLVTAGTVLVPMALSRGAHEPSTEVAAPATTARTHPSGQRLLLLNAGMHMTTTGGDDSGGVVGDGAGLAELLPDSSVVHHPLPNLDGWYSFVGLPDGRLVGLGYHKNPTAPDVRLTVLSKAGAVTLTRQVEAGGQPVRLVGADERVAYLWRPTGLVSHDLHTGREKTLLSPTVFGDRPVDLPPNRIDLLADRLVIAGGKAQPCRLRIIDLYSRTPTELDLARLHCTSIGMVRLSPDTTRVAIGYQGDTTATAPAETTGTNGTTAGTTGQARIAVVDIGSGAVAIDKAVSPPGDPTADTMAKQPAGMAWLDPVTVRVALLALPTDTTRVYRLDEVLVEQMVRVN